MPVAKPKAPQPEPTTTAALAPEPKTMRVASLTDTVPAPAPAVAATPASGSGWVVQVASQRSQNDAAATYQSLQKRFGSIFGGMKPSIRQADLGEKGTFYRIRVGSWSSRDAATSFCVKLKAAGGDCVVTRN